jgi:hypothetical protein
VRGVIAGIFFLAAACRKPADDACIGAANAKHAFVYMHGRDERTPSSQEVHNRDVLRQLAGELDARFAIARADTPCKDAANQLCWGWAFGAAELDHAAKLADAAADKCFSHDTKYALVGFSNGGYAIDAMVARCALGKLLPRATRGVTVGAAMFKGPLGDGPTDLSTCGDLTMIVGTKDEWNFDPSDNYLHELEKRGARARTVHVPGATHELLVDPLREALRE